EVWQLQGNKITPRFVRAVKDRIIETHPRQTAENIRGTLSRALPGIMPPQSVEAFLYQFDAKAKGFERAWLRDREIEARELELKPKPALESDLESLPSRKGLTFDERRQRVCIDGTWEDLNGEQTKFWAIVSKANGAWTPGSHIGGRAAKIKESMPPRVQAEIESHKRNGYRLRRFVP